MSYILFSIHSPHGSDRWGGFRLGKLDCCGNSERVANCFFFKKVTLKLDLNGVTKKGQNRWCDAERCSYQCISVDIAG